jgi:transcription antitermination protein NusB
MGARSKARKRALDILFESEQRGLPPGATLPERRQADTPPVAEYTVTLVEGVIEHAGDIDAIISAHADGWALERMPAVDRNILRVAVYELMHMPSVPRPVVLSEAVAMAGELSTDDSPAFVNGVLAAVAGATLSPATPET